MTTRDGRVWTYIEERLRDGPLHMTLLDPASVDDDGGAAVAEKAAGFGTHAFMVGGSTDVTGENLDRLVQTIKDRTHLPVIYFPSTAGAFSPRVDAVYFLSVLNSRDVFYVVGEQAKGAPLLKTLGIEPIGLGYIIVEPGMTVGRVSKVQAVPRSDKGHDEAIGYALAAEAFGMPLVYLEAGSGAPAPVPGDMVRAVKETLSVPLMVGGGIREPAQADAILDAGADVLVTGTIAEEGDFKALESIVARVNARRGP